MRVAPVFWVMVGTAMVESCPSAETLAAYGDDKLTPAERREVEKHLAACEDCFELFAGAAAFRLEEAAEPRPVGELPPSRRARYRWWRSAVAAAVLAAGVWVVVGGRAGLTGRGDVLAWADELGDENELRAAAARSWSGGGGGFGFGGGLPVDKRAFRLGVHLLDARLALAAGDGEHWNAALDQVATLVPSRSEPARLVDGLRTEDGLDDGNARTRNLDELVTAARTPAPEAFDLGAWAEAGRLAALGGRTRFLEAELAGRSAAVAPTAGADPLVASELATIRGALDDRQVSAAELSALEHSFRQVILLH